VFVYLLQYNLLAERMPLEREHEEVSSSPTGAIGGNQVVPEIGPPTSRANLHEIELLLNRENLKATQPLVGTIYQYTVKAHEKIPLRLKNAPRDIVG